MYKMVKQTRKKKIRKNLQKSNKDRNSSKVKKKNGKRSRLAHKSKSKKNRRHRGDAPMIGIFCEVFGSSVRNRVIENLLSANYVGIAIPDLAEESGISKQRAYNIMYDFEKKGLVKRYRIIGKTQIWIINEKNREIKILQIAFKECMKMVGKEYKEKYSHNNNKSRAKITT